ncbi:MAG: SpoIIE family protein phosphatase [bacterium]
MNHGLPLDVPMLRSALDYMNLGVYITDRDRRIHLWNRKAEEITGHKSADVIGRACCENILVHVDKDKHPLCSTDLCPLYRSMMLDKESKKPLLLYARRADNSRVAVSVNTAPMHDPSGEVVGGIETFIDSTAQIHDLEFAKRMQRHALADIPAGPIGVDFDVKYFPHDLVGGDFYDIREVAPGRYGFMVADVIGHGVSAALYTMLLRSLSESLGRLADRPDEFLTAMNRELTKFVVEEGFATAFYGVISVDRHEIVFANAGHPAPLLYGSEDGTLRRLESHELPLGVLGDAGYRSVAIKLRPGDLLLCFTDGVTESVGRDGDLLGEDGLAKILREEIYGSGNGLLSRIYRSVKESCGDISLSDDVTLLSVAIPSKGRS